MWSVIEYKKLKGIGIAVTPVENAPNEWHATVETLLTYYIGAANSQLSSRAPQLPFADMRQAVASFCWQRRACHG